MGNFIYKKEAIGGGGGGASDASAITYTKSDGTTSTVQEELNGLKENMGGLSFGTDGEGNYGYFGADGSLIPFSSEIPKLYLVKDKIHDENVSGGWATASGNSSSGITQGSGGLDFNVNADSGLTFNSKNLIDVTDYKRMHVICTTYVSGTDQIGQTGGVVGLSKTGQKADIVAAFTTGAPYLTATTYKNHYIIDLDELEGSYYINGYITKSGPWHHFAMTVTDWYFT